jgi:hypothetical protein
MSDDAKAGEAKPAEIEVDGVTETQFKVARRNDPAFALFLKYLGDYADDLTKAASERWLAGSLVLSDEKEMLGFIRALRQAGDLSLASIKTFYDQQAAIARAEEAARLERRKAIEEGREPEQ